MKVSIELQNGKEQIYKDVKRIDENSYKVTLYGEDGIVAIIDKEDIKNLFTEERDNEKNT
jgi:hypothetical protein